MAFAGGLGLRVRGLSSVPVKGEVPLPAVLFSESPSRFLLEAEPSQVARLESILGDLPRSVIGEVTGDGRFVVEGEGGRRLVDESLADLKEAWQAPLRW